MNKETIISILNEFTVELFEKQDDGHWIEAVKESDFPAIAEKLSQLDGWVKCRERLPEEDQFVFAYYPLGSIPIIFCYKGDNNWLAVDGELWLTKDITHWKPLPSNPD